MSDVKAVKRKRKTVTRKKGQGQGAAVTSAAHIATLERERQALLLRKEGESLQTIADKLGYAGPSGAYKAIQAAMQAIIQEPAEEVRDMELLRLDTLLQSIWWRAKTGDVPAVQTALKIMERRAKLIGLDAPTKYEDVGLSKLMAFIQMKGLKASDVFATMLEELAGASSTND